MRFDTSDEDVEVLLAGRLRQPLGQRLAGKIGRTDDHVEGQGKGGDGHDHGGCGEPATGAGRGCGGAVSICEGRITDIPGTGILNVQTEGPRPAQQPPRDLDPGGLRIGVGDQPTVAVLIDLAKLSAIHRQIGCIIGGIGRIRRFRCAP